MSHDSGYDYEIMCCPKPVQRPFTVEFQNGKKLRDLKGRIKRFASRDAAIRFMRK